MKDKKFSVLLTAFQGTSSEKIIQSFGDEYYKLILVNDKGNSVNQLISAIDVHRPDYIISFGQKPVIKDKIYIEFRGRENDTIYETNFDVEGLEDAFENVGFSVCKSYNAGTSYCNHIYVNGLKYLREKEYEGKMVFVHVPFAKNMSSLVEYAVSVKRAVEMFLGVE
ncbi:MAG: hypothetical protein IJ409_03470 [Lachnospiraceae bacterium]|nr:hypothetical protein [Lachnospiraceae bacterium]